MNKLYLSLFLFFVSVTFSVAQTEGKVYNASELDSKPVFAKGVMTLNEFLKFYQKYPEEAKAQNETGTVLLTLTISSEGEVENSKILKGVSESLDKEALRLSDMMPTFSPGIKNGRAVKSNIILPVSFGEDTGFATSTDGNDGQQKAHTETDGKKYPLYVIDGKIVNDDIRVNADNIESVRVMKGEKAIERYGERAVDGVIIFKTKSVTTR